MTDPIAAAAAAITTGHALFPPAVFDVARLLFASAILAINSYTDYKHREIIGSDRIYIALAAAATTLLIADFILFDTPETFVANLLLVSASLGLILFFYYPLRAMASGDLVVLLTITIFVTPTIWFLPAVAVLAGFMLAAITAVSYNLTLNMRRPPILPDGKTPAPRLAWFVAHMQRNYETHVVPATHKDGTFNPAAKTIGVTKWQQPQGRSVLVTNAIPMIPFVTTVYAGTTFFVLWFVAL